MADAPTTAPEPSMEEILASIRRIISDDKEEPPSPPEEPLELTQELQDDGSVVDLAEPEPEPEPEPPPPPPPPPPVVEPVIEPTPPLVSEHVATEAASSLHTLANTVEIEELSSAPRNSYIGNGARTLEDMVLELMRPLLRQWLDQNLPPIVDRLVQKEIERISRRSKD